MASWTSEYFIVWICLVPRSVVGSGSCLMCQVMHCICVMLWRIVERLLWIWEWDWLVVLRHWYVLCHCLRMLASGTHSHFLPPAETVQCHFCVSDCALPYLCTRLCSAISMYQAVQCLPLCGMPQKTIIFIFITPRATNHIIWILIAWRLGTP